VASRSNVRTRRGHERLVRVSEVVSVMSRRFSFRAQAANFFGPSFAGAGACGRGLPQALPGQLRLRILGDLLPFTSDSV